MNIYDIMKFIVNNTIEAKRVVVTERAIACLLKTKKCHKDIRHKGNNKNFSILCLCVLVAKVVL